MMARARTLLLSLLVMLAAMFLVNCSPYGCRVTFGSSSCTPSGSGVGGGGGTGGGGTGGGGGGGGTTIAASNATALVYFLSGSSVEAAGFGGTTFAPLTGYTAPTIPSGFADNMTIVNEKFVYIPMGNTTVQGFSITRSTGALTPITGSPFSTNGGGTTDGAWSDPQGRFLFVGSEAAGAIWVFQIDATTGALTETTGSPFTVGLTAADIMAIDASGKYLYVGQLTPAAGVAAFSIDQTTGALTTLAGSPFNLQIAQIRATRTGEYLVGVQEIQDQGGSATDLHVYVYSINSTTGVPTAVTGSPFATTGAPYDVTISPNGNFVYLPEVASGGSFTALEGFALNQTTGALTPISGSPFSSLPIATQCQFDQSGAVVLCATSGGQMTALGASASTGALTHVADLAVTPFAFAVTD